MLALSAKDLVESRHPSCLLFQPRISLGAAPLYTTAEAARSQFEVVLCNPVARQQRYCSTHPTNGVPNSQLKYFHILRYRSASPCRALSVPAKKDSAVRLRVCAWHDAARPAIPASGPSGARSISMALTISWRGGPRTAGCCCARSRRVISASVESSCSSARDAHVDADVC